MFRAAVPLLLFLIATVVAAQTMSDLTARYGYPDAERFVARPGITMMASYAEDRTACEMLIEPKHSIQQSNDKEQSMATDNVTMIIDELIPKSERGILLNRIIESMGAGEYQVAEYQNVTSGDISFVTCQRIGTRNVPQSFAKMDCAGRQPLLKSTCLLIKLTATNLHTQYGDSDVERFIARPGITLMVAYDTDQAGCQMVVESTRSIIPRDESAKYMRPEVVTEILDEVMPEADRGKLLFDSITKSGCNEYQITRYQNVTVSHSRHKCRLPNPDIEGTATVTRKNSSCGNSAN